MMRWRLSDFAVIGLLAFLAAATALLQNAPLRGAQTAGLGADDIKIRSVISAQMAAFRAENHAAAFYLATPDLQDQMGTVDAFMDMVRQHYRPVYRARNFDFTGAAKKVSAHQGMRIQRVFITDEKGSGHRARYIMQKQPDGSWKIAGCQLLGSSQLEI